MVPSANPCRGRREGWTDDILVTCRLDVMRSEARSQPSLVPLVLSALALLGTLIRGADLVHWCTCQETAERGLEVAGFCGGSLMGDRIPSTGSGPVMDPAGCTHEVADDHIRRGSRASGPLVFAAMAFAGNSRVAASRSSPRRPVTTRRAGGRGVITPWVRRL